MSRRGEAQPQFAAERPPGVVDQGCDTFADSLPTEGGLEVEGRRYGQPRARIARSLELEQVQPRRRAELVGLVKSGTIGLPAPAHLQRLEAILVARPEVEKPGPGRRQQPLVTVRSVEI